MGETWGTFHYRKICCFFAVLVSCVVLHAPTSPRSTGFCVIWDIISSSSSSDVNAKEAGVDVDLEFEGAVREALAIAWEVSHSERVSMGVHLEVYVPDVRPNEFF